VRGMGTMQYVMRSADRREALDHRERAFASAGAIALVTFFASGGVASAQNQSRRTRHRIQSQIVVSVPDAPPTVPAAAPATIAAPSVCECCVPGAQVACACGGGAVGFQVCSPAGTSFDACRCGVVERPAPTPMVVTALPRPAPVTLNEVAERPASRRWYGWQTAIVDGLGYAVAAAGIADADAPLYIGLSIQLIGVPIVHWAHGNTSAGFGSLGLRFLGGGLVALGGTIDDGDSFGVFAGLGGLILVGTTILDIAVLPYDRVAPTSDRPTAARARPTNWGLALSPRAGGFSAGFSGQF
jgi:hypothetical protein